MSMPSFPENGTDITREQAFNMIISSIAMEELALSHIINAEGEKLQFILGTLPGGSNCCPNTSELLEVNKSIVHLLDAVMQNQMLLKGKLDSVLEAQTPLCPKPCDDCENHCPVQAKSSLQLSQTCHGTVCGTSCPISWSQCCYKLGGNLVWEPDAPEIVRLRSEKQYAVSYTVNVRVMSCQSGTAQIGMQILPKKAFTEILPVWFSTRGAAGGILTLSGTTLLCPYESAEAFATFKLILNCSDRLSIEQASIRFVELEL